MQQRARQDSVSTRIAIGAIITLLVSVVGLYIVKWAPYYHKSFAAAAHHSIGKPMVGAHGAALWTAALHYAFTYFNAIWEALLVALLVGACVQVLIPKQWIARGLGTVGWRSGIATAIFCSVGMMCTCCSAPIVVGLRKQAASPGIAMATFVGMPTLNPAVLLFIFFVLSWQLALLRLCVGIALVFAVAFAAERLGVHEKTVPMADANVAEDRGFSAFVRAWLRVLWWEVYTIVPGYVVVVLALGLLQAWLFQPHLLQSANPWLTGVIAAIAGTIFVIPTGAEVPIVQYLLGAGIGIVPAAVLLIALPAISLPSMYIARSAFRPRVFAAVGAIVAATALLAAFIAAVLRLHA